VGTTKITWTAVDAVGNTTACFIIVTVKDTERPYFANCPSGQVFNIDLFSDACETAAIWSIPVAFDNCTRAPWVYLSAGPKPGDMLHAGSYSVEYTADDGHGNKAVCKFRVDVIDTEEPLLVCRPDLVMGSDKGVCTWTSGPGTLSPLLEDSNCPATVHWIVEGSDGIPVSGDGDVSGYVFELGTSTIRYYLEEDISGQLDSCMFTLTIIDREAPVLSCGAALDVMALAGDCSADIELSVPGFSDNCSLGADSISYRVYGPGNTLSAVIPGDNLIYHFANGLSRVEWTLTDEAGNIAHCLQDVTVSPDKDALRPYAGEDAAICKTESYELSTATAPAFATLKWGTSGTGTFSDAGIAGPVYTPSAVDIVDGFVVLTLTASIECASASDEMVLRISAPPHVSAGADAVICQDDSYQLNGNILSIAASYQWTSTGSGTFSDAGARDPVYTPGASDITAGEVLLIFRGISGSSCADAIDTMRLSIDMQPVLFAGEETWVCQGEGFVLSGATISHGGAVEWTTSGSGTFDDNTLLNPVYTPSGADILNGGTVLTVTHVPGGPCSVARAQVRLNISLHPSAKAGPDMTTCFGDALLIGGASAQNYGQVRWTTTGSGSLSGNTTLMPTYTPGAGETGEIAFTLMVTGSGACIVDTLYDQLSLTIYEQVIIEAGADDTIYHGNAAQLNVVVENGSGSYQYIWEPANLVLDPSADYTKTVSLTGDTHFDVTVIDSYSGCRATDFVTVYVTDDIGDVLDIFNAFSPNGDGVNDDWVIEGIEGFPDNRVMIFNRWGDKIKDLYGYDNVNVVWDGTNNKGKPLPDGTYYYVVDIIGVKSFTGWVHIRSNRR
jgi:gliding motility-associated-like protein